MRQRCCSISNILVQLLETNVIRVVSKTSSAHEETVFSDYTMSVGADTALPRTRAKSSRVRKPQVSVSHFPVFKGGKLIHSILQLKSNRERGSARVRLYITAYPIIYTSGF